MNFIWLEEKISLKYLLIGGVNVFRCLDWLKPNILLSNKFLFQAIFETYSHTINGCYEIWWRLLYPRKRKERNRIFRKIRRRIERNTLKNFITIWVFLPHILIKNLNWMDSGKSFFNSNSFEPARDIFVWRSDRPFISWTMDVLYCEKNSDMKIFCLENSTSLELI